MRIVATLIATLAIFPMSLLSAAEIVPHEATYASTLEKYHGPGELQSWEGTTRYSISRDCQKWKIVTRMIFNFTINGTESQIKATSRTYEALDGNRMEFDTLTQLNGDVINHKKGVAKLQGAGKPGVVTYREPQGETLDLPAGTAFTIASTLGSIDQLGAGKKQWKQLMFSDGEFANYTYNVRKRGVVPSVNPSGDANLISQAGWLLETKMFSQGPAGNIQVTALAHANGVTSLATQNNEMFTTREELIDIRALPTPHC